MHFLKMILLKGKLMGITSDVGSMRTIPIKYRKLHIVIRFNGYFDNLFLSYPFSEWQFSDLFLLIRRKKFSDIYMYKALQFLICLKLSCIHVLFKHSSFRENVIGMTSNIAPNHVIPCGNIYARIFHYF